MRRLFKTIHTQHASGIHATLAATICGFAILEYFATHRGGIALLLQFIEHYCGIITQHELHQNIYDVLLGASLVEVDFY